MAKDTSELRGLEFDALRREIEIHISERRKIESQIVVGVSVLYAWMFSFDDSANPNLIRLALAIPPIVILLSFCRWASLHIRTMKIGKYIHSLEVEELKGSVGWETFISADRAKRPFWGQLEGWTEFFVWLTLLVGSLVALILLPSLLAK